MVRDGYKWIGVGGWKARDLVGLDGGRKEVSLLVHLAQQVLLQLLNLAV